jgi:hypothetical protein
VVRNEHKETAGVEMEMERKTESFCAASLTVDQYIGRTADRSDNGVQCAPFRKCHSARKSERGGNGGTANGLCEKFS